jgi:hypothetical protein
MQGVFEMPRPKSPKKHNGSVEPATSVNPEPVFNPGSVPVETAAPLASAATESANGEMKTATARKPRKPEMVRTETRSNLFPINVEDEIRRLAYLMAERRGFQPGHETEDWLSAEREVRERYHQQTA